MSRHGDPRPFSLSLRHVPAEIHLRRTKRQNLMMLGLASALGLWLGFGAPTTSPVASTPVAATVPAATVELPADQPAALDLPDAPRGPGGFGGAGRRGGAGR